MPAPAACQFPGPAGDAAGGLRNTRMGPLQAKVTLSDGATRPLREQTLFATNGQAVPFSFEIKPDKPGYYEYAIGTPARDGEANRANNSVGLRRVRADRKAECADPGRRTLLGHEIPLPPVARADEHDRRRVFRVAKDRYFKVTSDTALTAVAADAFPESDEAMSRFDLVVVGRGSEYLFDENRARTLERFVRDHGDACSSRAANRITDPPRRCRTWNPSNGAETRRAVSGLSPCRPGSMPAWFRRLAAGAGQSCLDRAARP